MSSPFSSHLFSLLSIFPSFSSLLLSSLESSRERNGSWRFPAGRPQHGAGGGARAGAARPMRRSRAGSTARPRRRSRRGRVQPGFGVGGTRPCPSHAARGATPPPLGGQAPSPQLPWLLLPTGHPDGSARIACTFCGGRVVRAAGSPSHRPGRARPGCGKPRFFFHFQICRLMLNSFSGNLVLYNFSYNFRSL